MDTNLLQRTEAKNLAVGFTVALIHTSSGMKLDEVTNAMNIFYKSIMAMGVDPVVAIQDKPAVDPSKSVFPSYIICLEDGKSFKSLKRHLTTLGLTPDEYRRKWGLPSTYPMVAEEYSSRRSSLAKSMGLGTKPQERPKARKK